MEKIYNINFDECRKRIPIIQIAEDLGYERVSGINANNLTYILGNKNNPTEEIIIFPKANSYCPRTGKGIAGDNGGELTKFILNRLHMFPYSTQPGYKGVTEVLGKYLNGDVTTARPIQTNSSSHQSNELKKQFNLNYWDPQPLEKDNTYLINRRHLSSKTVDDFRKRVFVYKAGKNNHIAFPYRKPGQMEITNFELRNYFPVNNVNYKGFPSGGDKANSCWIANFVPFDKVTDIYLFESAIDAMSFYEINHFNDKTTSAFISTGGYVSKNQIEKIQLVFPNSKVNWHCCFDNDGSGNCFDVTTAYYLSGEDCKAFKQSIDNGYIIKVSFPTGESYSLDEKSFSSTEFLKSKNRNEIIDIIKPPKYKDWNELLTYYKRFDLNLGPGMKFLPAIDEVKSQLNLRGHIYLSEMFETKGKELIQSLMDKETYTLSAPLAETNAYKLIVDCNVFMGIDTMVPVPTNLYIFDKTTQKTINAHSINEFLKKEYINIFRDLTANDFKNLLEKKVLTYTKGNVERKFEGILSPSGWGLKECATLKKKDIDLGLDL